MNSVVVFGGTGFLGEAIIDELILNEYTPILFVRNIKKVEKRWRNKVRLVEGNFDNMQNYNIELSKFSPQSIIYSIGIIKENGGSTFEQAHYKYLVNAIKLAKNMGISKFVYISANGVGHNKTKYQKTKLKAEVKLQDSGLDYTILRPSIIMAESKKYNFLHVIDTLTQFIFTPLIGGGMYIFAPIERSKVAWTAVQALFDPKFAFKIEKLVGEEITFKNLIKQRAKEKNRTVIFVYIPMFVVKLITFFFGWLPFYPVTYDQLVMIEQGNS